MEDFLEGKTILFFAPAFFGYEKIIANKMESMGAAVDLYDVRSVKSARDRALLKISPLLFSKRSREYYDNIIEANLKKDYDYILIVKCDMTPECILARFRIVYPHAKLCLYLWDSIANIPGITNKLKYFDVLHSFDKEDCKKHTELTFRPLFYADEYCQRLMTRENKYDISFIGTIHSDRFAVIKDVRGLAEEKKLKCYWYCYLQSKLIFYFYRFTKREFFDTKLSDFFFEKKSSKEIADTIAQSKIVLDIQHPKQTGLTMRTIEMIGMNKKLITTNSSIKEYDFYNPKNISVIDRNKVYIDDSFLDGDYEPIRDEVFQKYSLLNWVLDVLK